MRYKKSNSIKYFVIIIVILTIVFISQQSYSKEFGKDWVIKTSESMSGYWAKGASWVSEHVYSRASEEVQNRGEVVKKEIEEKKAEASEKISEKIKNYFSRMVDSVIHPGENNNTNSNNQNCQPAQPLSQPIYAE